MILRPAALFATALLLAGCATPRARPVAPLVAPPVATPAGATLTLADWNMEFVAARDGAGCHPRVERDYAALRQAVDAIDADVFAFEEVENEAAAARVFDPARYTVVMEHRVPALGGDCGPEQPGQRYIRQAVGIAIRKGLAFSRAPDLDALEVGNPNLRAGVEITVRPDGGTPLRVLALHLKSGCFQGRDAAACPTLFAQAPVLDAWIAAAGRAGTRFAVMGDWNRRLALPGDRVWAGVLAAAPGLVLTDAGVPARCDPRYPDFIDHLVLDPAAAAGAGPLTETVFAAGQDPSDHCPISVRVAR